MRYSAKPKVGLRRTGGWRSSFIGKGAGDVKDNAFPLITFSILYTILYPRLSRQIHPARLFSFSVSYCFFLFVLLFCKCISTRFDAIPFQPCRPPTSHTRSFFHPKRNEMKVHGESPNAMGQRLHSLATVGWHVSPREAAVPQALPSRTEQRLWGRRAAGAADKEVQGFIPHAGRQTVVLQLPALHLGGCCH